MWVVRDEMNQSKRFLKHSDDSLTHYGVKGMKWGVRKEPELKGRGGGFGSGKTGDNSKESFVSKAKKAFNNHKEKKEFDNAHKDETIKTKYGNVLVNNFDSSDYEKSKHFVDYIAEKYPDRYMDTDKAKAIVNNLPKQDGHWRTEVMQIKQNNHDPQTSDDPRWSNCFKASMSYEMRMRGYDVQAKPGPHGGWGDEAMHCFDVKDTFEISFTSPTTSDKRELAKEAYRQLEQKCLSYGDGARGELGIQYYDYDSGHSMYWVVEDGEFRIIDSQAAYRDGYETFLHAEVTNSGITVCRLDNADILPGVTDFVEPFEATEEEKRASLTKKAQPTMDKEMNPQSRRTMESESAKRREAIINANTNKRLKKQIEAGRSNISKFIDKIGKTASDVVSSGKSFLKSIFKK